MPGDLMSGKLGQDPGSAGLIRRVTGHEVKRTERHFPSKFFEVGAQGAQNAVQRLSKRFRAGEGERKLLDRLRLDIDAPHFLRAAIFIEEKSDDPAAGSKVGRPVFMPQSLSRKIRKKERVASEGMLPAGRKQESGRELFKMWLLQRKDSFLVMFWVLPAAERPGSEGLGSCEQGSASVTCADRGRRPLDTYQPFFEGLDPKIY